MGLLQLVRDSGSQSARIGRSAQPRYGVFGLDAESEARHESGDVRTAAALLATLGLAAVCWVVAIRRMNGMDMGVATTLGSFGFFVGVWVTMMEAMMLPGAARRSSEERVLMMGRERCRSSSRPTSLSGRSWAWRSTRCIGRTERSQPAWL